MPLQKHDLHFLFAESEQAIKGFDALHQEVWRAEARNSTVNSGSYSHWGACPPGEYVLGVPQAHHSPPFGFFFTLIEDYADHHSMRDWGRAGIGIHGGGSGLPDPYAPHQGWIITEGCIRLQNQQNQEFVAHVRKAQAVGGRCYLTVTR